MISPLAGKVYRFLQREVDVPTVNADRVRLADGAETDTALVGKASAWPRELRRDYVEVREWLSSVFADRSADHYLLDILDDAIAVGLSSLVGLGTSMHDLVIAPLPAAPPVDVVVVRLPGSLRPPRDGNVRIEFVTAAGQATAIERPSSDGLALGKNSQPNSAFCAGRPGDRSSNAGWSSARSPPIGS
jgi:hypothetical protein